MGRRVMGRDTTETLIVDLYISPEDYLMHYQGQVSQVHARALDGRQVRFPSNILIPYVTRDGISGRFAIKFDQQRKFIGIERLGSSSGN